MNSVLGQVLSIGERIQQAAAVLTPLKENPDYEVLHLSSTVDGYIQAAMIPINSMTGVLKPAQEKLAIFEEISAFLERTEAISETHRLKQAYEPYVEYFFNEEAVKAFEGALATGNLQQAYDVLTSTVPYFKEAIPAFDANAVANEFQKGLDTAEEIIKMLDDTPGKAKSLTALFQLGFSSFHTVKAFSAAFEGMLASMTIGVEQYITILQNPDTAKSYAGGIAAGILDRQEPDWKSKDGWQQRLDRETQSKLSEITKIINTLQSYRDQLKQIANEVTQMGQQILSWANETLDVATDLWKHIGFPTKEYMEKHKQALLDYKAKFSS